VPPTHCCREATRSLCHGAAAYDRARGAQCALRRWRACAELAAASRGLRRSAASAAALRACGYALARMREAADEVSSLRLRGSGSSTPSRSPLRHLSAALGMRSSPASPPLPGPSIAPRPFGLAQPGAGWPVAARAAVWRWRLEARFRAACAAATAAADHHRRRRAAAAFVGALAEYGELRRFFRLAPFYHWRGWARAAAFDALHTHATRRSGFHRSSRLPRTPQPPAGAFARRRWSDLPVRLAVGSPFARLAPAFRLWANLAFRHGAARSAHRSVTVNTARHALAHAWGRWLRAKRTSLARWACSRAALRAWRERIRFANGRALRNWAAAAALNRSARRADALARYWVRAIAARGGLRSWLARAAALQLARAPFLDRQGRLRRRGALRAWRRAAVAADAARASRVTTNRRVVAGLLGRWRAWAGVRRDTAARALFSGESLAQRRLVHCWQAWRAAASGGVAVPPPPLGLPYRSGPHSLRRLQLFSASAAGSTPSTPYATVRTTTGTFPALEHREHTCSSNATVRTTGTFPALEHRERTCSSNASEASTLRTPAAGRSSSHVNSSLGGAMLTLGATNGRRAAAHAAAWAAHAAAREQRRALYCLGAAAQRRSTAASLDTWARVRWATATATTALCAWLALAAARRTARALSARAARLATARAVGDAWLHLASHASGLRCQADAVLASRVRAAASALGEALARLADVRVRRRATAAARAHRARLALRRWACAALTLEALGAVGYRAASAARRAALHSNLLRWHALGSDSQRTRTSRRAADARRANLELARALRVWVELWAAARARSAAAAGVWSAGRQRCAQAGWRRWVGAHAAEVRRAARAASEAAREASEAAREAASRRVEAESRAAQAESAARVAAESAARARVEEELRRTVAESEAAARREAEARARAESEARARAEAAVSISIYLSLHLSIYHYL